MEALLVSLYGYRPRDAGQLPPASSPPPSGPQQEVAPPQSPSEQSAGHLKESTPEHRAQADPASQASVCSSSSSSVADDWIADPLPAGLDSLGSSLQGDQTAEPGSAGETAAAGQQISAEDWSRGTALVDPATGEPLQPVRIHQPLRAREGERTEGGPGQASPGKRLALNAVTEKRAALTAYDLIGSRAVRAPLSPAALFEREARGEVLRENPAASLQEVSHGLQQRWKNLGEDQRKK